MTRGEASGVWSGCMDRVLDKVGAMLGLLLLAAPLARAQDLPTAEEEVPVVASVAVPSPEPFAETWRWVRRSPVRGEHVEDVAVQPGFPDHLVAVDARGRIWRSRDGGRIWSLLVDEAGAGLELSNDEDILLDVDARLGEVLADGEPLDFDVELDEAEVEEAVGLALQDALDLGAGEILTDLESDPGFMLRNTDRPEATPPRVMYVGDRLFAAIGGVLLTSDDDAKTFEEVLYKGVFDVVGLDAVRVALTTDGARVSLDGRAWVDFDDGTESRRMVDGERAAEVLLAATQSGLWATTDGQNWERWGQLREPIRSVAVHPDRPDEVWISAASGVRRSTDRGRTFGPPLLPGRVDDVALPESGHVVIVRAGNVLETLDGGISWRPVTRGLPGVSGGRLETTEEGRLLLAAPDGLWALQPIGETSIGPAGPWLPLDDLVGAALDRGASPRDFNAFRRRYAAAALPTLQLDGYLFPAGPDGRLNQRQDWSVNAGTALQREVTWFVRARVTWTPRTSRSVALQDLDDVGAADTGVIVVGSEPLLLTGQDDYVVAARMQRAFVADRGVLASTVTDLYRTRAELVAERATLGTARLQRQVNHELAIAELEARLDALTQGAVTRWQATQAISQEL